MLNGRPTLPQIIVDHFDPVGGPTQMDGALDQTVLQPRTFAMLQDLAE